ncbi:FAD-dependent oxidoreductase [soil metagenome]
MQVAAEGRGPLLQDGAAYDVAVIGAGGAGLAAALFAALNGQKVLLLESTSLVGGTTALSAGSVWIPGTRHAASVASGSHADTLAEAVRYLDAAVGRHSDPALRQAFLTQGPEAIDVLETRTEVRFRPYPRHPDYLAALPGATLAGRVLEPLPFDGRLLGNLLPLLRPPLPEFTVLGGMMVDRTDIGHLLGMRRSFASLRHAASIVMRHLVDRLRHPRGTRLVMGNALVGRLLVSLAAQSVATLALQARVRDFRQDASGAIRGLVVEQGGHRVTLQVRQGVILATGGFSRHPEMRRTLLPGIADEWSPTAPGATGELLDIARSVGAHWGERGHSHAFWAPVSLRTRADGTTAAFPHFVMDRAKPGVLAVDPAGERFVNESTSYHLFGLALQERHRSAPTIPAYLVCDARALQAYGLGMVRPGGMGLRAALADGYLVTGRTLAELSCRLFMDFAVLGATVARFNQHADRGTDPDFARGTTAYERHLGDPSAGGANPSLGRLDQGPFYALKLYPGDIGTATGLATDDRARVLGSDGQAIAGLYAVGNDMHSVMGGVYPGPGITLGPALVFARIAAQDAAARPGNST